MEPVHFAPVVDPGDATSAPVAGGEFSQTRLRRRNSWNQLPSFSKGAPQMWETRPVAFVLDLPHDIASTVEEVSHRDPDYLRRVIRYGIARRAVYQSLQRRLDDSGLYDGAPPRPDTPTDPTDASGDQPAR